MKRGRLGQISVVLGVLSVPVAGAAAYFRSLLGGRGTSFIIDWLMARGATLERPATVHAVSNPGLLSVTDERAVALLVTISVILAGGAMAFALASEHRRERTLYLSVGYICGALAIFELRPLFGMIAMIGGIAIAMVMRHSRGARDT